MIVTHVVIENHVALLVRVRQRRPLQRQGTRQPDLPVYAAAGRPCFPIPQQPAREKWEQTKRRMSIRADAANVPAF